MSDLHASLLTALDGFDEALAEPGGLLDSAGDVSAALRAVVELHRPHRSMTRSICMECYQRKQPCSTIRVIAEQFGIPLSTPEKENPTDE